MSNSNCQSLNLERPNKKFPKKMFVTIIGTIPKLFILAIYTVFISFCCCSFLTVMEMTIIRGREGPSYGPMHTAHSLLKVMNE